MPWKEVSAVSLREEFVMLARADGANMAALCRRFGVSRQTGYKWLSRFEERGRVGLVDCSRRPQRSPSKTAVNMEDAIVALRRKHPAWGARKLRARLQALAHANVPAASTVHAVLKRHDLICPAEGKKHQAWQRFEHATPNDLWQMDFKGHFA